MYSILDTIIDELNAAEYSLVGVKAYPPYAPDITTFPLVVVQEIVNMPRRGQQTVGDETRTSLSYQIDIYTKACRNVDGDVLTPYAAGQLLTKEVDAIMRGLSIMRTSTTPMSDPMSDVMRIAWRGDCTVDSYNYIYRT